MPTRTQLESLLSGRHGSFYRAISEALRCADPRHRERLWAAFGHDIEQVTRAGGLGDVMEAFGLLEDHQNPPLLAPARRRYSASGAGGTGLRRGRIEGGQEGGKGNLRAIDGSARNATIGESREDFRAMESKKQEGRFLLDGSIADKVGVDATNTLVIQRQDATPVVYHRCSVNGEIKTLLLLGSWMVTSTIKTLQRDGLIGVCESAG